MQFCIGCLKNAMVTPTHCEVAAGVSGGGGVPKTCFTNRVLIQINCAQNFTPCFRKTNFNIIINF